MSVSSCTITGDLYRADENSPVVFRSSHGVFKFESVNGEFLGRVKPYEQSRFEDAELLESGVSYEAYYFGPTVLFPMREVSSFELNTVYVLDGEQLLNVRGSRIVTTDVRADEGDGSRVVEVYPSVSKDGEREDYTPMFVEYDGLVTSFEEERVEEVYVA